MTKLLAWAAIAVLGTYLIFAGGNWWGIYTSTLRVATMVGAAALLATWAFVAWRRPSWRPRSVLLPAIAACLGSLAVSTAFSRYPRISLEYLGYAIVLAALYLLLVRLLADPFFRRRLPVLMSMLFVVTAGAFLFRVGVTWVDWWRLMGGLTMPPLRPSFEGLTFGNPSAVLTMVVLLAVPTAATFGSASRRGIAVSAAVIATVGVVALISGSRAGWLALALTAVIVPTIWLASRENRALLSAALRPIWCKGAGKAGIAAIAAGAVVLAVLFAPSVIRRAAEGGENLRLTFSLAALRMFSDAPVVGTGPGTWVIQRMAYTQAGEPDTYIPHAHSVGPQTLAELGVVGAVAGVVLVASIAWLLRGAVGGADPTRRRWAWVALAGLTYFVLHQVLDFYVNMPAFLFVAALPIAYLDATAEPTPITSRFAGRLAVEPPRAVTAIAGLVIGIAIAGLLWQEGPAGQLAKAVEAGNRGDWPAADGPARAAAAADPDISSYQLTAGLTAARAGDHEAAAAAFQRVATRDDLPEAWLNLAAEQAELGLSADALASIERALRIGSQRPAVAMPAGDLAMRLGEGSLARRGFAAALTAIPSLASDPWWQETPARQAALRDAATAADASASDGVRWQLALMSGNVSLATALTGGEGAAGFEANIVRAWNGDPAAVDRVLEECRANGLDIYRILWCGRVEGHRGNVEGALRFRTLADIVAQSSAQYAGAFRVADVQYTKISGEAADLWGLFTYRRPAPWDILVPSLVHLTSI